jgi:hypothetical protein
LCRQREERVGQRVISSGGPEEEEEEEEVKEIFFLFFFPVWLFSYPVFGCSNFREENNRTEQEVEEVENTGR